jgi:hypothetical protein
MVTYADKWDKLLVSSAVEGATAYAKRQKDHIDRMGEGMCLMMAWHGIVIPHDEKERSVTL